MVAFAKDYLPAENPARFQNRAECFFAREPGRVGCGAPAARFHAGENSCCRYDACQGTSLAQGGDWTEVEGPHGELRYRATAPDGANLLSLGSAELSTGITLELDGWLEIPEYGTLTFHDAVLTGTYGGNFRTGIGFGRLDLASGSIVAQLSVAPVGAIVTDVTLAVGHANGKFNGVLSATYARGVAAGGQIYGKEPPRTFDHSFSATYGSARNVIGPMQKAFVRHVLGGNNPRGYGPRGRR